MQRTTYSVSASVSCTGSEDLNSGPRSWNSGMAASCSVEEKTGRVSSVCEGPDCGPEEGLLSTPW